MLSLCEKLWELCLGVGTTNNSTSFVTAGFRLRLTLHTTQALLPNTSEANPVWLRQAFAHQASVERPLCHLVGLMCLNNVKWLQHFFCYCHASLTTIYLLLHPIEFVSLQSKN